MSVVLATIGAIASLAATVVKTLTVTGLAIEGLRALGGALVGFCRAVGLMQKETKVDDLGDKAIQSNLNPDDYDCYNDYVKAVEKFDKLDPEKSKNISMEDKIKKGMELATGVMIEKYSDHLPITEFCETVGRNPEFFTEIAMEKIGNIVQNNDKTLTDILNYINKAEKDDFKMESAFDTLMGIEKSVKPDITDVDAAKNVLNLK